MQLMYQCHRSWFNSVNDPARTWPDNPSSIVLHHSFTAITVLLLGYFTFHIAKQCSETGTAMHWPNGHDVYHTSNDALKAL